MSKLVEIQSLRIIALLVHIFCVTPLYWTRIDSITISTINSNEQEISNENYVALISLAIICLVIQGIYLGYHFTNITFYYCIHIVFDIIGSFFSLWIALDSLTWKTYIVIVTFCVIIPTCIDILSLFLLWNQTTRVNFKQKTYIERNKCWPY